MTKRAFFKKNIQLVISIVILSMLFLGTSYQVQANTPERMDAFVYALTVFDGQIYQSSFVPPSEDTIYLLADIPNVLAARETKIYYWSLTNRFEADWFAKNEFIEGTLEIVKNGVTIKSISPTDTVVQYDTNFPQEPRRLITGPQAGVAYNNFLQVQKEYRDNLYAYYELQQLYRDLVDEIIASGTTIPEDQFPQPPQEPAPISLFSSEITQGYVLDLPVGQYQIQLRLPDGSLYDESRKNITVIDEKQTGISFSIMPQARWSKPTISQIPDSVIYAPVGSILYLEPSRQGLFEEYAYRHLVDPQDFSARRNQDEWVIYQPITEGFLEITSFGGGQQMLPLSGYKIIQIASSGLGYEVRLFDQETMGGAPSFRGFEIILDSPQDSIHIRLLDKEGNEFAGSRREIRVIHTEPVLWLYLFAIIPILIGIGIVFYRLKVVRKIQVEE